MDENWEVNNAADHHLANVHITAGPAPRNCAYPRELQELQRFYLVNRSLRVPISVMPGALAAVTADQLDHHGCVLVDGQSLLSVNRRFNRPVSWEIVNRAAANLLQNVVLHDYVLVDSQLLLINEGCRRVAELFPDAIKALRIPAETRGKIADTLEETGVVPDDSTLADLAGDRRIVDWITRGDAEHNESQKGLALRDVPDEQRLDALDYEYGGIPAVLQNTDRTAFRAHYYLELSRHLRFYYAPHPARAEYFSKIVKVRTDQGQQPDELEGMAIKAVNYLEERIASKGNPFAFIDLTIPPVAEYAVRTSVRKRIGVDVAIAELRNSPNAVAFRRWCAERNRVVMQGRAGLKEAQKIFKELDKVCSEWATDIEEGVRYRTRKIQWSELPWLGSILKSLEIDKLLKLVGWEEREIRDPVLRADKPYLLFLNDLYRSD